jgi:transcriptional regulator with XRE-family HTH domain
MTPENYPNEPSGREKNGLQTGDQLRTWRRAHGLSAKELSALIGVTERSIHRAERSPKIGARIKLAMKLLEARISHGEITLQGTIEAVPRAEIPEKGRSTIVMEPVAPYGKPWHGKLRTGADLRAWRESIDLYQQELAALLDVAVTTVVRAEQSREPSSRLIYGVELLRSKVLSGEVDLRKIREGRVRRGRPKKK